MDIGCLPFIHTSNPENIHLKVKYYCMADLYLGLTKFTTYKEQHILLFGRIQSGQTGDKKSPYGECSLPYPHHKDIVYISPSLSVSSLIFSLPWESELSKLKF